MTTEQMPLYSVDQQTITCAAHRWITLSPTKARSPKMGLFISSPAFKLVQRKNFCVKVRRSMQRSRSNGTEQKIQIQWNRTPPVPPPSLPPFPSTLMKRRQTFKKARSESSFLSLPLLYVDYNYYSDVPLFIVSSQVKMKGTFRLGTFYPLEILWQIFH